MIKFGLCKGRIMARYTGNNKNGVKRKCGCCGENLYINKNNIDDAIYYDKKHIIVVALSIYVRSVLLIKEQTYQQNGLGYMTTLIL